MVSIGISVILGLAMSWLLGKVSRMAGGGAPKLPLGLDQWIYAIPYGLAGILASIHVKQSIDVFGLIDLPLWGLFGLISYLIAFLGKRLGHGTYFDLATSLKKIIPERIDFLVRPFFGKDPNSVAAGVPGDRDRDLFGLTLTGLVVGLGLIGVLLYVGQPLWALVIGITTAAKGPLYLLSLKHNATVRKVLSKIGIHMDDPKGHTEPGEWLTGIVGGLGVFSLIFFLINNKVQLINLLLSLLGV